MLGEPAPLPAHRRHHAFHFLSNHLHLSIGARPGPQSAFLEWTLREISGESTSCWTGREPAGAEPCIQITTLEDALERLAYIMGQGTAQFLALPPAEDIFPSSTPALLFGKPVEGLHVPTGSPSS
ncbi:MAG: hypothetical protein R3F60_13275 [bacterium]